MNKFFSRITLDILNRAIGEQSLKYLQNTKVIFSSIIYARSNYLDRTGNANIILKKKETPLLLDDWLVYLILRSFSRTWIVSGKNLRDEKDLNFLNDINFYNLNDVENYFYLGKESFDINSKISESLKLKYQWNRNILIFSKSLTINQILTFPFFKETFAKKYILNNKHLENEYKQYLHLEFFNKYQIKLIENITNFGELVDYSLDSIENSTPILSEIGPSIFSRVLQGLEGKNSIDFIVISVFYGDLNPNVIGSEFPSLKTLIEGGYQVINISDKIPVPEGELQFYTLINKNIHSI